MKLTFYGATRTTTGSKFLLEANGRRLLLECGMFQGRRAESIERNTKLPFEASSIHAVALSHAHIDHSGIIPVLSKSGYSGKIHCTPATKDLCEIMLVDSAHIQEQDAEFVSKKNSRKGLSPVAPLFTQDDARAALPQFSSVPYKCPIQLADGIHATWVEAGHILGSASVLLKVQENGRSVRLGFTGDIGRGNSNLYNDPEPFEEVDYLMIESTYGGREHEDLANLNQRVCNIINRAVERKGKVIIPAFAIGRTQQLLYTLNQLVAENCIPALPVYVDSPLAVNATDVFEKHLDCLNNNFQASMHSNGNPFARINIVYITEVEDSKKLNDLQEPCIILSASGMAEAGRIRHHLKNHIEDDRNTILIVGWCAPHTLGSRLASGHAEVRIFGENYKVCAHVETINAFSGHADRSELRDYISKVGGVLKGCFLVHGEHDQAEALADAVRTLKPDTPVSIPSFGDSVEL